MAKTTRKAGKRAMTAGRGGLRARKSGVAKTHDAKPRKPKPARPGPRKGKPFPPSETASLKRQLKAARMQQEASAEILRAVANAAGDAAGPLQLIAETTALLFRASSVAIQLAEGSEFTQEYRVGAIAKRVGAAYPRSNIKVGGRNLPGTVVFENRQIHIPDLDHLDPSMSDFPGLPHARAGGARTVCGTPLRREGKAIGSLIALRDRLLPFTDDELALLQSFADQAVIAIENARLFNNTQEALARQTASADILRVISQSPTDVQQVFDAIALAAVRLLGCERAFIQRCDGASFWTVSWCGPEGQLPILNASPIPIDPEANFPSRAIAENRTLHLPDWSAIDLPEFEREIQKRLGINSALYMPLRREGECIGLLAMAGKRTNIFGASEIALAESFRDQAVIAIENVRLFDEVQTKTTDLQESLQQQTATADVLKVISRSAFELEPALVAVCETAARLCDAEQAAIFQREGEFYRFVACFGFPPEYENAWRAAGLIRNDPKSPLPGHRAVAERRVVQILDVTADPAYPATTSGQSQARTALGVPLMRDGEPVGNFVLARRRVEAFSDRQLELIQTFADQAVIAIENARLFNETKEALERQTATAEILNAIASSPADTQPVFDVIARSATELCEGMNSGVYLLQDGLIHVAGHHNVSPEQIALTKTAFPTPPHRGIMSGRAILNRDVAHVPDIAADPEYTAESIVKAGFRSVVAVPMLRNGEPIGAINVTREEARPFSDRQIELLRTFADQAVIAIENTRLFNETQEALERQTASAEILKVIASSPSDAQPVFNALVLTARRLLGREMTGILLCGEDATFRAVAGAGPDGLIPIDPVFAAPTKIDPEANFPSRAIVSKKNLHLPDWSAIDLPEEERKVREIIGWSSTLYLPMLRGEECIGVLLVGGTQPGIFSEADIALAESFRDQAVIAIENARLFNETREALERQTATAEVLQVISNSISSAAPVFERILESTERLITFENAAIIVTIPDEQIDLVAFRGPQVAAMQGRYPRPLAQSSLPIMIETRRQVCFEDAANGPDVPALLRQIALATTKGNLSIAMTPLMWEGNVIGMLNVSRDPGVKFNEKELSLLRTFADQAVIAIQNARLFNEVQAKTRELTARNSAYSEQIDHQSATIEILKAMSASPGDAQPVFDVIVWRAMQICSADIAVVLELRDALVHLQAIATDESSTSPEVVEAYRKIFPQPPSRDSVALRAIFHGEIIHIPNMAEDLELSQASRDIGPKGALAIPLLRDGKVIGSIGLSAKVVGGFSEAQIELLKTFAEQAVIAIRSAETFRQLHTRTSELSESLQQQTATADVLKVISRSAFDLQSVFDTLTASATQLCEADYGIIFLRKEDAFYAHATSGARPAMLDFLKANPRRLSDKSMVPRVARTGAVVHIPDIKLDPEYEFVGVQQALGYEARATLGVPLLRNGAVEGVFVLGRYAPKPFTGRQIELIESFADQAVIAIQNVRLFDEVQARTRDLQESLEYQTATSDVLKVISRSSFDLQPVLDTLIDTAVKLCGALNGTICLREGDGYRYRASSGIHGDWARFLDEHPPTPGRGSITGRVLLSGRTESVPDVLEDPDYVVPIAAMNKTRSAFGVPLLRHDRVEGVLLLARAEPGLFTQRQMELVQTFADQAVIAIENARLLTELRQRTDDLTESLENLRTAQDRLVQTEKLASLGQLTAGIAHEIKNPLNFVNNFSALSAELIDELDETLAPAPLDQKMRGDVGELTQMLKSNLEKVVQHGKRADSIVKNMLLHSREGSGEQRSADINALLDESLNLAYHGARAEKPEFNITLRRDLDPDAGTINVFPQEITRAFINLISNGFYAASKRKAGNGEADFEPVLSAATKNLGNHIEIRIRDNGTGIPPEVKDKIFNPFFTTKPSGEGTGLGLSMSHDIIVKQHGGSIDVETEPGLFTEFKILLPRTGQR